MVSTAALRRSYPEFITRWPTADSPPRCNFRSAVTVVFLAAAPDYPAGVVVLRVHPATVQIWRVVAAVQLAYRYPFTAKAGGTLRCRRITGGTGTTLHAHGIAKDDNPARNRYRRRVGVIQWGRETDMPRAMVRAIEALKLTNGLHPIEWGGRWWNVKDPMHFEVDVLQSRLSPVNLATLPAGAWRRYLAFEATHHQPTDGSQEDDVELIKDLQKMLKTAGATDYDNKVLVVDGVWGKRTESAFVAGLKLGGAATGTVDAAARKTANDALAAANRSNGILAKLAGVFD